MGRLRAKNKVKINAIKCDNFIDLTFLLFIFFLSYFSLSFATRLRCVEEIENLFIFSVFSYEQKIFTLKNFVFRTLERKIMDNLF